MNDNDLKLLWQSTNQKLEDNLKINKKNTEEITKLKAQNLLSSMKPTKIFALIVGVIWVIILGGILANLFLYAYNKVSPFFLYSATIQVILTIITIVVYVYQLNLIQKIDFSEPILEIQKKLSQLKISTLNVAKVIFLQLPLWTTFYWTEKMIRYENIFGNIFLWSIQIFITLSFIFLSIWFFFNIKYENKEKKWFQIIFSGKEWQPIIQAMELLEQIEEYQKGN